jgi:adenylate cyclase, class 2
LRYNPFFMILNVEIKAACPDADFVRKWLLAHQAEFRGTDHQIDTYFNVANGRLKLREGNIENALIQYEREDKADLKTSRINLLPVVEGNKLKLILERSLGVKVVVEKKREIYFIDNVKFHIDEIHGLGNFVEIEAIDIDGSRGYETIRQQCDGYMKELDISKKNLISMSYSDMLIKKNIIG